MDTLVNSSRGMMVLFAFTSGAVLGITGVAKVLSSFGSAIALTVVDPISGIQFRYLMLSVGVAEVAIAILCLFTKRYLLGTTVVASIATVFAVYRFGLWFLGWQSPCNCLGNLTEVLHISPELADNAMKVLLAYLLLGSYGLLLWQWKGRWGENKYVTAP